MIYVLFVALVLAALAAVLVGLGVWLGQRGARPSAATRARGYRGDEVDDDLRNVFIAEVKSEIGNLRRNLMLWKAAPTNLARLMPLRRSFHTLKGSSRMVGVPTLGDFNARFERLLDRVIDKSLSPDAAVVAVVEQAVAALPELLAQFEGQRTPRADIAAIMKTADRLIKSERAVVRPLRSGDAADSLPTAGAAAQAVRAVRSAATPPPPPRSSAAESPRRDDDTTPH
ncbi:Hpt domain-containing protein [Tahibacter sp. UC22_41]|uniref:Hpt domain-containing protein n=1 Tax=Tahibacter sp. UC22_41 TaxID=3350178 RepID=UPI0036DF5120